MPHRRGQHREPAELLQVLDGVGQQPRREDHQQQADDGEEPGHIQPVAQPVDHECDGERTGQPDSRPAQRARRRGGKDDGQGKDYGLKPLAAYRLEGQQPQPPAGPAVQRGVDVSAQLLRQRARMVAHPERHVGQHGGGDHEGDGLEDRLHPRSVVAPDRLVGDRPARRGQDQRGTHSQEHVPEVLPLPDAVEVGEQDRDDHACLDTLAQENDERSQHQNLQPPSLAGAVQLGKAYLTYVWHGGGDGRLGPASGLP